MSDGEQDTPQRDRYHVQSLARGLAVIRAFDETRPELTLSEVARAVNLTRAAARRFLLTLMDLGYVRSDGRRFSLTPRVLELGHAFLSSLTLPELSQPHLERLSAEVSESSSVSVLDEGWVVYVARVATSRIMSVAINVGTRFPAYATSMGRVLLAGLPPDELDTHLAAAELEPLTPHTVTDPQALRAEIDRVRAQGWVIVDQELEPGLRSIAVPLHDRHGQVVAAMNVSSHAGHSSLERLRTEMLPALQRTAEAIEADLAAVGRDRPVG